MAAQVEGVLYAAAADLVEVDSSGNPLLIHTFTPATIDAGVDIWLYDSSIGG